MPGVVTAIGQHDEGLLMAVDSSTKFVRSETVLDVLGDIRKKCPDSWMDEAKRQLCGSIVMTQYNNKTYKVDDLVAGGDNTPDGKTFMKNNKEMSVIDYYKQQHNIEIQVSKQPLIECLPSAADRCDGRTQNIFLVPELCCMTGLTDTMRSDFNLMRKIGDVSRLKPADRVRTLNEFMGRVMDNEKVRAEMGVWDIGFEKDLVRIKGRVLPCERIYMNGDTDTSAAVFNQKSGDFSREIRTKRLYNACTINKWMILVSKKLSPLVEDFVNGLHRVCSPLGIQLNQPRQETLSDDNTSTIINAMTTKVPPVCEMLVIIVPDTDQNRYDAIKRVSFCERPMATQVIVGQTLAKKDGLLSVCTKVAIQMAVKLGAEPWVLKIPAKELMVVGYDTYEDLTKGKSVGAFVCSLNHNLSIWHSRASFHDNHDNMSANFANDMKEAMERYFGINKSFPKRIIIYRDGVADGMIRHVFEIEVKQVLAAIKDMPGVETPQLAFVIVTKQTNARFFTDELNPDNPSPGTIVDKTVTRSSRYDFYLISQSVRQGTVTPTMYNIIHDTTGFRPEHHQQLAYKLTHLYYNWQGTIRVPAPCHYAHKLAFLTATSLHREPSLILSDRLFYL